MTGYFERLERELAAAAERTPQTRRRGMRVALLAAAVLVVAGVPAAAVLNRDDDRGREDADRLLHTEPIATGTTPRGTRWELLASDDERGFCFGTTMPRDDPEELAPAAGVTCGEHEAGELTIHVSSTIPARDSRDRRRHSLASGTAPDEAVSVTITRGDGKISVRTLDDSKGIKGRFYVAEIPLRWQRGRRHVVALDAHGEVVARAGG